MRRAFITYTLIVVVLLLQGCRKAANRSSIGYNNDTNTEIRSRGSRNSTGTGKVVDQPSRGKKYDGSTIFKKYSSAVFMIFTSDGKHAYQGSGFFINNNWCVLFCFTSNIR